MHPATRTAIYRRLRAANPAPTTELEHSSPFELLVAVMLSAHTTDKSVNAATRNLFPVANTPAAILALGVEGVKPYIRAVGLYNTKAKNLIGLCRQLLERHGGELPADRASLEALPAAKTTPRIDVDTVLTQSNAAFCHVSASAEQIDFSYPGGHLYIHRGAEKDLLYMVNTATFRVREVPGQLTDEVRVALATSLVQIGFLQVVPAAAVAARTR